MILINIKLISLLLTYIGVALSFDCSGLNTLDLYLLNRGGSLNSAKCVAIVDLDFKSPNILNSKNCDTLVVDSTDSSYSQILSSAGITCPIITGTDVNVFNLYGGISGARLRSIACVEGTCNLNELYKNIFESMLKLSARNVILPIISSSSDLRSKASNAAFEIRTFLMRTYGDRMRCPFQIIIPTSDLSSYQTILDVFSLAFTRDQAKYKNSLIEMPKSSLRPSTPSPPSHLTPIIPPSRPSTYVPPLSDFNQYDGIACPTMKNLFTLLSELQDPYLSKYTAVTTQISVTTSDFSLGIHSCDLIVMDSDSDIFIDLMNQMGLKFDYSTQETGVTIRSPLFKRNNSQWFSSLQKIMYLSLRDAINEAKNLQSLTELIKEAYENIFKYANTNRLSEILILPFGLWSNRNGNSIEITTSCIEGLSEALNSFLLENSNTHVTLVAESKESLSVLIDQIKPHFMSVRASEEFLNNNKYSQNTIIKPKRPPPPPPVLSSPLKPISTSNRIWMPVSNSAFYFDFDNACLSETPLSEIIQEIFNSQLPITSSSRKISLVNSSPVNVIGCSCLVVDVSSESQLSLLRYLGVSESDCRSVGSSEIKVIHTHSSSYLSGPWASSITRVYCINSSRFIYNSRIKATGKLYQKILSSAKYRCSTVITPLISVNLSTSETRNKEYLLEAITNVDQFFTHSSQRDAIHVTFYEENYRLLELALELFSTYYLEYNSVGGTSATIRTVNQNWIGIHTSAPQFSFNFRPLDQRKKTKCPSCTLKKLFTRRSTTTTTTTTTIPRSKIPPPRPPLPKFVGNKNADRPAPSNTKSFISFSDFVNGHSKQNCNQLYSLNYWISSTTGYANSYYRDYAKNIFVTCTYVSTDIENCPIVVLSSLERDLSKILGSIGHSYPILSDGVTVLANNRYGDSRTPISKTLNRIFLVNVDQNSILTTYDKILSKALANQEKTLFLPIFGLSNLYSVSKGRSISLIKNVLNFILKFFRDKNSNMKLYFYEGNPSASYLLFEVFCSILSGREIV